MSDFPPGRIRRPDNLKLICRAIRSFGDWTDICSVISNQGIRWCYDCYQVILEYRNWEGSICDIFCKLYDGLMDNTGTTLITLLGWRSDRHRYELPTWQSQLPHSGSQISMIFYPQTQPELPVMRVRLLYAWCAVHASDQSYILFDSEY